MANLWTLAQVFHRSAREHPGHTMVVAGGIKQSDAQVDARSSSLAAAISEWGLGAGDRAAIILPNRPEWTVALLACAKLGATIVPVNPRLDYHELKYQLRHAEVAAAFTAEQYDGIDCLQHFEDVIVELPDLQYLVAVGEEELWYDDRIFPHHDPERRADDVSLVDARCHVRSVTPSHSPQRRRRRRLGLRGPGLPRPRILGRRDGIGARGDRPDSGGHTPWRLTPTGARRPSVVRCGAST